MVVTCPTCGTTYDDAQRLTYCPHDLLMPLKDLARKHAALKLLGHRVAFAHQPGIAFQVQAVSYNGMVALEGMAGQFAPHLFVVVEDAPR